MKIPSAKLRRQARRFQEPLRHSIYKPYFIIPCLVIAALAIGITFGKDGPSMDWVKIFCYIMYISLLFLLIPAARLSAKTQASLLLWEMRYRLRITTSFLTKSQMNLSDIVDELEENPNLTAEQRIRLICIKDSLTDSKKEINDIQKKGGI